MCPILANRFGHFRHQLVPKGYSIAFTIGSQGAKQSKGVPDSTTMVKNNIPKPAPMNASLTRWSQTSKFFSTNGRMQNNALDIEARSKYS